MNYGAASGTIGYAADANIQTAVQEKMAMAQMNAVPIRQPTFAEDFISQLDSIGSLLNETVNQQKEFLSRLHGPSPEEASNKSIPPSNGALSSIQERLARVMEQARRAIDNQIVINRIA